MMDGKTSAPRLWYFTRYLPRSWRLALLEALAWPEFEVSRLWVVSGPAGVRVEHIPLADTARKIAAVARAFAPEAQ